MTSLRELYRQHDEAWEAFVGLPGGERSAAFDAHYEGDEPACVLHREMAGISQLIGEHPDYRDFEVDLRDALGDEICAAPESVGHYSAEDRDNKAVAVYCALGNVEWEHEKGSRFTISFRGAGGLIAEIRGEGDYLDWYCSGSEGHVDDDIAEALAARGWKFKEIR